MLLIVSSFKHEFVDYKLKGLKEIQLLSLGDNDLLGFSVSGDFNAVSPRDPAVSGVCGAQTGSQSQQPPMLSGQWA